MRQLVACGHVLAHALKAHDGVHDQGQTPELAVVLAQIVGGQDGGGGLSRGNRISASYCGVGAVKVGRLHLRVANAFFARQPVLPRE